MTERINELLTIVKNNRQYSEWTKEQDIDAFSKELLSEAQEVIDAIKNDDLENLKEELGDVLFDVLTLFAICEEKYGFGTDESIMMVIEKFKHRKPHIFEKKTVDKEEEEKIWYDAKRKEKEAKSKKEIIHIKHKKIFINTDGGSRGNPGNAAIGIVIRDDKDKIIENHKERIGVTTNNVAEYKAIIKALELAKKYTSDEIELSSDSEVVVRQIIGKYKVTKDHLIELFNEVKSKEKSFRKVNYNHVFREDPYQSRADALVNQALDGE